MIVVILSQDYNEIVDVAGVFNEDTYGKLDAELRTRELLIGDPHWYSVSWEYWEPGAKEPAEERFWLRDQWFAEFGSGPT